MTDNGATPTAGAPSPETVRHGPGMPIEPYTCRYCGWVTTVPSEAKARLCMRCVRFEGDVHPAITGARIAAHNARIMGMIKKKD
ncbi:hypothetical protein [Mesorhizobium sp.]|uniref:hypothetical protein n=1 Tax=Mesorhizobium sp. TaxID=1871066 RepID=UPI000FE53CE8|nr:hypothetical protein [Mesorhizobium sp.]RWP68185.1 MAG: hypothetical protein EOR07_08195 [Mesorhizobium sp.]